MPQFFVPAECISDGFFHLKGPEAHHLVRVMRYGPMDVLEIFDGKGKKYLARLDRILGTREVEGTILSEVGGVSPRYAVGLYFALVSREKVEEILEKGTEIGVSYFCPLLTERTGIKLRSESKKSKLERWRQIILAACKQSGRPLLPPIVAPVSLDKAFGSSSQDLVREMSYSPGREVFSLVAWEREKSYTIQTALQDIKTRMAEGSEIRLFIGPEGGFTEAEIDSAKNQEIRPVSLGPCTLRSETAALVASSLLLLS
ncbi:MAG: 16S rRNA (uracil(1498)-N(3))-methyltransferase, partial [Elusimicrobia bacterium]|nr:16S rRNA (uracil(1498)-N(3))-methyltransferase [Elusimicrobiota bacterium]